MERTIEIGGISDELLARLNERAAESGVDREAYVRRLIEKAVAPQPAPGSLAELLAPLRAYSASQAMTEEEIGDFFEQEAARARSEGARVRPSERLNG